LVGTYCIIRQLERHIGDTIGHCSVTSPNSKQHNNRDTNLINVVASVDT